MHIYMKYGASVITLLAAMSLAQAQNEHQGSEKGGGAAEHGQTERGKEGGAKEHAPAAQERSKGETRASTTKEQQPAKPEHNANREKSEPGNTVNRTAKASANEGEHKAEGKEERQRQSNAGAAGREAVGREGGRPSNSKVNIHITGVQKTKLHDAIDHDTAIRRYRASELHFTVEVGTRLPDDVIFYDAPLQFIDIDPEFRGYKIVVLEDEILVIDPETREIVDVIPT